MKTKLTPFKVMTSLLNNTTPTQEEKNTLNSFFLVRWLSNNPNTLPMANIINTWYNLPVDIQYQFCDDYIQLTRMKNRVKFISFQKDKQNPDFVKLMDNIQRMYNINEIQAQEYYKLMSNDEKNRIYNYYNEGIQK